MKRAKRKNPLEPRNPVAVSPLLAKGGAHQRRDKRAARARLEEVLHRQMVRDDDAP